MKKLVFGQEVNSILLTHSKKITATGILVFVKDHFTATSYQNPWKVLDGGNRLRAYDYIDNIFADAQGKKYEDLEHHLTLLNLTHFKFRVSG